MVREDRLICGYNYLITPKNIILPTKDRKTLPLVG